MKRMGSSTIVIGLLACVMCHSSFAAGKGPNILWLTSEDHGPAMGCYGDTNARTPNVDALAAKGMIFTCAWSTAPVCAPARTAIISGLYPSSSGGLHMRSMVSLPADLKLYPQFLREAGYYCSNNSKEDYNVRKPAKLWDESSGKAHWKNRDVGQPFFAIFNSMKSHESEIRTRPHQQVADPAKVRVPAYHPDTPEVREDWAQYYDKVGEADADAGLAADTIVFYYADHGSGMPRSKRWPSDSGLRVPLVVYFPEKWKHLAPREYQPGGKSDRLVSFVDLAPTLLSLAGIKPRLRRIFSASVGAWASAWIWCEASLMAAMSICATISRTSPKGNMSLTSLKPRPRVSGASFLIREKPPKPSPSSGACPKSRRNSTICRTIMMKSTILPPHPRIALFWQNCAPPSANTWSKHAMSPSCRRVKSFRAPRAARLTNWPAMKHGIR